MALLIFSSVALADFTGEVVAVIDGDTLDVRRNGQVERILLNGIDCPEKGQPYAKSATQYTSTLVFRKQVIVHPYTPKRDGRTVADVFVDETNVSRELLRVGLAWWFREDSNDLELERIEQEARLEKRGLWADTEPVPPWEWRKSR